MLALSRQRHSYQKGPSPMFDDPVPVPWKPDPNPQPWNEPQPEPWIAWLLKLI